MIKLAGQRKKYIFTFNSRNINELKTRTRMHMGVDAEVVIEEIGITDCDEYEELIKNLNTQKIYMTPDIKELMYIDEKRVWHCVLITSDFKTDGILVYTNGTDYALFTAYIEDILVESYN